MVTIWSSAAEKNRIHSAVALLKFCKNFPSQHETCARKMYLTFLKSCKSISAHNIHILSLMTNSLIEIFAMNIDKLSCLIFSKIRNLSETVRVAVKDSSKENLKKVYCWQFCAAIKLWGLLMTKPGSEKIANLVSPTISLAMELCCFQVSNFYGPFYLQMVRIALEIMEKNQIFIPINHILGHMIKTICSKRIEGSGKITGSSYCISFMIKASSSDQANTSYREALFEDCHTLLMRYIGITSTWACFPEIGINCQNLLNAALTDCSHKKFKSTLTISKNKLQSLVDATLKARISCELPPSSYDALHEQNTFSPVDFKAYVNSLNSVQKIKEKQAEKSIPSPSTLKNSNNLKSKPLSKLKKKINADIDDDKLVNFEL